MRIDEHLSALVVPPLFWLAGRPYAQMIRDLQYNETLSPEQIAELQFERLRTLLDHCYENVPFYRSMFNQLGAQPGDIKSLADYARLPSLSKETLKANPESLLATNFPRTDLVQVTTGGSTGVPVQLYHDRNYYSWGWAVFQRNLAWAGHRPGERQAWFTRPAHGGLKQEVALTLERRWLVGVTDQSQRTAAIWAEKMARYRPRLIYGYPSAIGSLARYLFENEIKIDSIQRIISTSETLADEQRELIERGLGGRVYNQYGATECYGLACECSHDSMHINSDINLVEFEPTDVRAVGSHGCEVVVTPLFNRSMPLLRYRIGDEAVSVAGQCDCGLPFPRMHMDVGRVADTLTFSDGTVISSVIPERVVRHVPGIARFQFRQIEPDVLELLIVKAAQFGETIDAAIPHMEDELEHEAGFRVKIRPRLVDDIPVTPAGKHRFVIPLGDVETDAVSATSGSGDTRSC